MSNPAPPPTRLRKCDEEIIRDHLEATADQLRREGAVALVEKWSQGRIGIGVYRGVSVNPRRPRPTGEPQDWVCAAWDKRDGAWRLYGPGIPIRTERCLIHALSEWRWKVRRFGELRTLWNEFKSSRSQKRWQAYLGGVILAVRQKIVRDGR